MIKKTKILILIIMLITAYSLLIINDKTNLLNINFLSTVHEFDSPAEQTVYWNDSNTGELFDCSIFNSRVVTNSDYRTGNYFSAMNDFCTNAGYHCDTWGQIANIYTSSTGVNYINCEWQPDVYPVRGTLGSYRCGEQNNVYSYIYSFNKLVDYCNSLGYWNCFTTYNGRSHSWYCSDREPDTNCYSCAGDEKTQDIFLKECPTGWTTNESIDCRPFVDCYQCSDETVHVESFQGQCADGWGLVNETIINNDNYCKKDIVAGKVWTDYLKEYLAYNVIFITLIMVLLFLFFEKE